MTDIPAPVLARFEGDLATRLGLVRKKTKTTSQAMNRRGMQGRGRMGSPLASLPNLNTDVVLERHDRDITLPAIANQPKHSSQLDLNRDRDAESNLQ